MQEEKTYVKIIAAELRLKTNADKTRFYKQLETAKNQTKLY